MKTPALLSVPFASALVCAALVGAGLTSASRAPEPAPTVADDHAALEDAMYGMKTHLKKLSRALTPETRDEALEQLTEMQRIVLDAKALAPSNLADVPEADRDAHRAEYRKEMLTLLTELAAIEMKVVDGSYDQAMEHVRGPLLEIRNRSHEKFQKDE